MTPKTKQLYKPHPADEAEVAAALAEADQGAGVELSSEQAEAYLRWLETGEGPCPIDEG